MLVPTAAVTSQLTCPGLKSLARIQHFSCQLYDRHTGSKLKACTAVGSCAGYLTKAVSPYPAAVSAPHRFSCSPLTPEERASFIDLNGFSHK